MIQAALDFSPRCQLPERGTQLRTLLDAFMRGEKLTIWNAMSEYGVGALHQRVKELRERGWPVKRREIVTHNGRRVAQFWMD